MAADPILFNTSCSGKEKDVPPVQVKVGTTGGDGGVIFFLSVACVNDQSGLKICKPTGKPCVYPQFLSNDK